MRIFILLAISLVVFRTAYASPVSKEDADTDLQADEEEEKDMQGDTNNDYYDEVDSAKPGSPDGSTETSNNPAEPAAQILTREAVLERNIGEHVVLPCQTPPEDNSVIIWYKNDVILFQGTLPFGSVKSNTKYVSDDSLAISNLTAEDAGFYKCSSVVSKNNLASITHTVKVRTPPSVIELRAKDNQTVLSVGEELVLTCEAKGYPQPVISWHKETMNEGKKENERLLLTGKTLTISNVTPRDEGRYLCFADNKIGKPALSYINIELTHPPVINVEKYLVNSDKNMDAELKCTVKSKPTATVSWLRNGINVKPTEHLKLTNEGNDHILILRGLEESDFGKYVCLAKNYLGTAEKSISLVKTPAVLNFIKPERPTRDMVLTWKVESKTPITEHELQYRKKGESEWQSVKPTVHEGEDGVYVIKHTLTGLEEGAYETRSRSQNQHGWSDYSEVTVVEGERAHHGKHGGKKHKHTTTEKPSAEAPEYSDKISAVGESKNAATHVSSSLFLCSITLFYSYFRRL